MVPGIGKRGRVFRRFAVERLGPTAVVHLHELHGTVHPGMCFIRMKR
jgi:hypothetical protein